MMQMNEKMLAGLNELAQKEQKEARNPNMEYDWVNHNKKAVAEDRDRIDRKGQALLVRIIALSCFCNCFTFLP